MSQLDEARREIDAVDAEMAALFERRMAAVAAVARHKQQTGTTVLDTAREAAVVKKNRARLQNEALVPYYEDFLRHLMGLSRGYQTEILGRSTVAYQGAEGGFGHHVAKTLYAHGALTSLPTFAAVFDAVEAGEAAFGVVPFENSNTGDVSGVLDLCYAHRCFITGMYDLPVQQNLLALPGTPLSGIKTVVSHVQALEQSRRFLEALGAELVPWANTAEAARHVAEEGDATKAAIASLESAALYGLVPLATDIATEAGNTTRFIIISKQRPLSGDRFSLLVTVENTVGQLARVIETISAGGFNMENIKSRPMPRRPWEYYFFIELVGTPDMAGFAQLMAEIEKVCLSVRLLGLYHRESEGTANA